MPEVSEIFINDLKLFYKLLITNKQISSNFILSLKDFYSKYGYLNEKFKHKVDFKLLTQSMDNIIQYSSKVFAIKKNAWPNLPVNPYLCPTNLMQAFRIERRETAHTAMLAWLFDPKLNPDISVKALEMIIEKVCFSDYKIDIITKVTAEQCIDENNIDDSGRFDVRVEGLLKDKIPFILIIEAKVDAKLGNNQLGKYDSSLMDYETNGYKIFRIFLTIDGNSEINFSWWNALSWAKLIELILQSVTQKDDLKPENWILTLYAASIYQNIYGLNSKTLDPFYFDFVSSINSLENLKGKTNA